MTFAPKKVLVTGAARRLGRVIAETLSAAGHGVVIHARSSTEEAQSLVDQLRAVNPATWVVRGDLGETEQLQGMLQEAASLVGGPLSGLVNSASVFDFDSAQHPDQAIFLHAMKVNLLAPTILSSLFASQAEDAGDACIVNVLDQKLWNLNPDFFSYTLSKAGLLAATEMMARAYAPRVRVNAVAPGLLMPSFDQTEAEFMTVASVNAMRRPINPRDVSAAVAFLMDNAGVTGEVIRIDNGQRLLPTERDVMFETRKP
jgi:NAD(P)-dependent dehydrogenase (short-subunit alcohol dehydrogenase family)